MLKSLLSDATERTDERGNRVQETTSCAQSRYFYDREVCPASQGWEQWDTEQDAWYFGVWVHRENRQILTYAEGDLILVSCPDADAFKAEIAHMEAFYGKAPVVAIAIAETVTEYVSDRVTASEI